MKDKDKGLQAQEICFPCEVFVGKGEPKACSRPTDYLSREEEEILSALRELKEKVRFLRGQIRGLQAALEMAEDGEGVKEELSGELREAMAEMQELRKAWEEMESRLKKANARKLALLGHGPWEDATNTRP
ncbi:MAG: hypothetical protein WHX93_17430 [bacterium]